MSSDKAELLLNLRLLPNNAAIVRDGLDWVVVGPFSAERNPDFEKALKAFISNKRNYP